MLLSELVDTSLRVGETSKRLAKLDLLAALLRKLESDEIEIAMNFIPRLNERDLKLLQKNRQRLQKSRLRKSLPRKKPSPTKQKHRKSKPSQLKMLQRVPTNQQKQKAPEEIDHESLFTQA